MDLIKTLKEIEDIKSLSGVKWRVLPPVKTNTYQYRSS